ncbi:MAG: DUF929 family protein, partial [Clostridia bacterium]
MPTWNHTYSVHVTLPQRLKEPVQTAPTVLFVGGEYCPYCAATRWALTIALSRFGTFSGVRYMYSASHNPYGQPETPPDIATMTYYGSHYRSHLIAVDLVEEWSRSYHALQRLTPREVGLVDRYDQPPFTYPNDRFSIPFIIIGGRFLWTAAPYQPVVLSGYTWSGILRAIRSGSGPVAHDIFASANEYTAAICLSDGNRPH